ncbi:alpha/beta-hydrolase [Lindgomyces ingoldianus]|uniref:Alpha/beta-hydrolase n=1 Tax=Lindgomyces ingoldianus TaxID=673940 RepID=A0ACB6QHX1_9PLEO|nr:alpha/beta-hydrolase [Lindgomyces ingoldianus]KAF2466178.1 alpha/beta-hydrolase [Lindgomyces ingoldianus]
MIGTSIFDYVFIRSCIFFLHWIAPLSVFCCLISLVYTPPFHVPLSLQVAAALETAFYFLVYHPRKIYLQRSATHPTTISRDERRALFQRCLENTPDPERFLTKWFVDAPASEIKRENLKDFFRWAYLNTGEPDIEENEELEEYVRRMEELLGRKLEPGRGKAECFRLTLNKVDMLHRSLTWYLVSSCGKNCACVFVVDTLASAYMLYHSFNFYPTSLHRFLSVFPFRPLGLLSSHRSPAKTIAYWHRPHTSKTRLPVLFIHGIGIGLYPYVNLLAELNSEDDTDGDLGIIAVEIMSVSFRITDEALKKEEMCQEIDCILKAHGWEKFVLVSHSYGSVIATHLLNTPKIAQRIDSLVFIDPVTFLLHLPDVAYNFTCRKPNRANEYQLHYFASKDMGVSHTLFRRFFWSENILWKEDIQNHRVTVVLGGKDLIVNTEAVRAYLASNGSASPEKGTWKEGHWKGDKLDVLWFSELDHAQVFDKRSTRATLVDIVRAYCDTE